MAKARKQKKPKRDETREERISMEIVVDAYDEEHKRTLAVPLSQLKVVHGDEVAGQAVEDWHYWVEMGYVL